MPWSRPPLAQLQTQAIQDITSGLTGGVALLRRSILRVLAYAQAGLAALHYGFLDWISRQAIPVTATDEFLYSWGALKNVFPKPATPATGTATFTGSGGSIVAGTQMTRADGVAYLALATGVIAFGTTSFPVRAVDPGAAGNSDSGTALTLATAIPGINSTGTTTALTGGTDPETADAFRARMLLAYQAPPQGGALADYLEWALAVPGVTRAWIKPDGAGPGSVVIYPMLDVANVGDDGFPQGTDGGATLETRVPAATGDQLTVADALYTERPVTALVYVAAPVAYPVDVEIDGLGAISSETQDAIAAALQGMFSLSAAVGGTAFPAPVSGLANGKVAPSQIDAAIQSVPGLKPYTLVAPAAVVTAPTGQLPTLGNIVYT